MARSALDDGVKVSEGAMLCSDAQLMALAGSLELALGSPVAFESLLRPQRLSKLSGELARAQHPALRETEHQDVRIWPLPPVQQRAFTLWEAEQVIWGRNRTPVSRFAPVCHLTSCIKLALRHWMCI
jgi:hypothetical protein